MLRATQSSDIPAGDITRVRAEDSERTRMLKTVMRSVAKFASGGLGKDSNESAKAAGQLIMKSQAEEDEEIRKLVTERGQDPCEWGALSRKQERDIRSTVDCDAEVAEAEAESEFAELLKYSGDRIKNFSSSLSSTRPLPPRQHIDTSPIDIYLVSRKEAEDIVAGGTTDHKRRDQAVWSWVQDNVKFKELDQLSSEKIGSIMELDQLSREELDQLSRDQVSWMYEDVYEELRGNFEQHFQHHPVLFKLTDNALIDESLWEGAVQAATFPTEAETEAAPKAQPSLSAPKATGMRRQFSPARSPGNSNAQAAAGVKAKPNRISWATAAAPGSHGKSLKK
jgi:hypothetical protein